MNRPADPLATWEIEWERYELSSRPRWQFQLDRRAFLAAVGGGVAVLGLSRPAAAQAPRGRGRQRDVPREIGAWLHIGEDGSVTVFTGKVEVGQDIRTSLAQAVAEELPVPLESIQLVMADTDRTPFDMGTFGSRTTPVMSAQLRRMAAAARELLLDVAAERWQADRSSLAAADGAVVDRQADRRLAFAELTQGQRLTQVVEEEPPTTPAGEWTVSGRSVAKVDAWKFVTGRHPYASDIRLPGMLYGKILRPPTIQARLVAADVSRAAAMPDVVVVEDGQFVGVAAASEFAATQALEAIDAQWESVGGPSDETLFDELQSGVESRVAFESGELDEGFRAADVRRDATYTLAYIAHVPLEPRAAVAEWDEDRLTVWTSTQRPFGVRSELAGALGVGEDRVRVIVPDAGSAYGGKHTGEAAVEAARLAREAGAPVKLVWTREEEFKWGYFRPAGVIRVAAGARRDGTLSAWEFHNYNSGASSIRTLYDVAHQHIAFHPARSPLRQGSYRALAATANHFARECHMDELAHAVGDDPLAFRLKNLSDSRLRAVLEAAAERFGWGQRAAEHHGFGLACGFEKGGYVATCVEVAVDPANDELQVLRAVTAFECGAVVNPDHLKSQIEGSVVMGLGGALFEAIEYEEGEIRNANLARYQLPRFQNAPPQDIVLLDRPDLPSAGGGETPIVAIAPAVSNAVYAAAGVRLRSLPMAPRGVLAR